MNRSMVDRIVAAVLYEGYILYPYRPSVKNRQRWTFGGLFPQDSSLARQGAEPCSLQTECLVLGTPAAALTVKVRFLHLVERTAGELTSPRAELPAGQEPAFRAVPVLQVGDRRLQSWQEAEERDIALPERKLVDLARQPYRQGFRFAGRRDLE